MLPYTNASKAEAEVKQLKSEIAQMQVEVTVERMTVSEAAQSLVAFTEKGFNEDNLIPGHLEKVPIPGNPFFDMDDDRFKVCGMSCAIM